MRPPPEIEATDGLAVDYVLGELGQEEARAFEQRLAADPELAREVERLRAVLGLVPYAKAVADAYGEGVFARCWGEGNQTISINGRSRRSRCQGIS